MYLSYYSLQREPFNITPNPDFLFLNESHKEALASMVYGIEKRKGFIAITGGIGLGKTTIVRAYLETKDDGHLKIIYVFNANITFKGLLKTIYQELELEEDGLDIAEMINLLHLTLISEYEAGNNVVLIIDEAQNMPVETLENLRMLSNLETSTDKLIQIVFIGQPEFDVLLNRPELRQLKQRVAIRTTLQPLNSQESVEYINHRLNRAGLKGESPFTPSALRSITKAARGVPRTINILCDNSLITGFGCDQRPVGLKVVREVQSDFTGKKVFLTKWSYITAAVVVLAIVAAFLLSPYGNLPIKWTRESFFSTTSRPDVVRIPITKTEPNLLEPTFGGQAEAAPDATPDGQTKTNEQVKPQAPADEGVVQAGSPHRKVGQGTRRRKVSSSESISASTGSGGHLDAKPGTQRDDGAYVVAPSQVDIAKDVDSRLLEMIKQGSPVSAPARLDEKVPSKATE